MISLVCPSMTAAMLLLASSVAFAGGSPVVFTAHDYGFTGPERIPAGVTTMQIVNRGQDLHQIQLLKLLEGKTAEDFRAAVAAQPGQIPGWVKFVGGPNAIVPGGDALATMPLAEGEYLLICLIPNEQGIPHLALGMQKALSVKGGKSVAVSVPKADVTITQEDFRFGLSRSITAGIHTVRVLNHGTQPHEVVVVKLAPGATASDFAAAVEPRTAMPPPGAPIGGVVGIERAGDAFFTAQFEPGRYGLICFFPDRATGAPHFAKGMALDFTVR
ncbi:MAG: hypothetical protein K2X00_04455 [Nitrospiraceae bacterium]|nr:hypothetical protein [Nitrospiraceae bacterium]OQW64580.1 MAG: hypothetical protein BVN29_12260 [Nitrospira sp. ST-bin5]